MTSSLSLTTQTIELAELGPDSPLPSVQAMLEPPYIVGGDIPEEIAAGSRWGKARNLYPYSMQEDYGRETSERELTAVVLENAHVKATFLPQLGGRLWSLTDKSSGKEMLHTQDRIQFANLALRNAWFAGGIEYNIGTRGHSPTTCAPLHTAIVRTPEGQEILRMWEFDRLREVVFQIDAWLPEDSKVVLVAVRIQNPNDKTVPMYWWTNAAVPQTPQTRVIAPAGKSYATDYDGSMTRVDTANLRGVDATWPMRNTQAADFFFDIAPDERRWEVAADDGGDGLALVSSALLRGRKLFVWGETVGGHRWQEWLTPSGDGAPQPYAEIQAGIAQTQYEHVPMPAGASWQWVEAYGNAALDPALAAGEWDAAVAHGAERVEALVSVADIDAALADAGRWADLPPSEFVVAGNGWGALERVRRQHSQANWIDEAGTPFGDETLTADQAPWLELLRANEGIVEKPFEATAGEAPSQPFGGAGAFVRGVDWEDLLTAGRNVSAEGAFHHAVMVHARASDSAGDLAVVATLYRKALEETFAGEPLGVRSRALAHRGLGLALLAAGDLPGGLAESAVACTLEPGNRNLLVEAMTLALDNGQPDLALGLLNGADGSLASLGRVRFLQASALADTGEAAAAAAIMKEGIEVPDLREGVNSLSDLWNRVCPGEPVPAEYQFSMH
ncbi:hypothetical protein JOF48_000631 [Arthrobacter stackebrandtii]|uniref:DUF5107 domain-containing protein n=1 Tax=Arthrobacter stackebrandtii TaxID=272161 RepID=A0ABS4YSR3_9MICC|nr:DUF5107 domain-containing protein [Arthrobacter stackebrandtii]MBP2411832.1 hypothetical protein [Arthrobacter stackebrandtii]PYG99130.1 DUF5107 domain-containing protein [Arthrobacter stackebrandtii]